MFVPYCAYSKPPATFPVVRLNALYSVFLKLSCEYDRSRYGGFGVDASPASSSGGSAESSTTTSRAFTSLPASAISFGSVSSQAHRLTHDQRPTDPRKKSLRMHDRREASPSAI